MEFVWILLCDYLMDNNNDKCKAYIALGSVLFLIISGTAKQDLLFDSLASDVIWLMIGSFILGRALQITGLAEKMTYFVVSRARNISGLCGILTMIIQILAFLFHQHLDGRGCITCFSSYIKRNWE